MRETTPYLKLPLPHPDNDLADDVEPLREAFGKLDAGFAAVDTALALKADAAAVAEALAEKADAADLSALEERTAAALKNSVNYAQIFYIANTGGF